MKILISFFSIGMCIFCFSQNMQAQDLPSAHQEAKLQSWRCTRCHNYNYEGIRACAYCGKSRKA